MVYFGVAVFFVAMTEVFVAVYQLNSVDSVLERSYFLKGVYVTRSLFLVAWFVCGVAFVLDIEFWWSLVLGVVISTLLFALAQFRVTK